MNITLNLLVNYQEMAGVARIILYCVSGTSKSLSWLSAVWRHRLVANQGLPQRHCNETQEIVGKI
jgi:hypothetical protein